MMQTCSEQNCDRPHYGRGYCRLHWSRVKRNGHAQLIADPNKKCSVFGCGEKHMARGLCSKHYQRVAKNGTLTPKFHKGVGVEERIRRKSAATNNGCFEYQGKLTKKGYAHVKNDEGKMRFAHVIMFEEANGPVPDGMELDHLCRNRACWNPAHLEAVTHRENVRRGNAGCNHTDLPRDKSGRFGRVDRGLV